MNNLQKSEIETSINDDLFEYYPEVASILIQSISFEHDVEILKRLKSVTKYKAGEPCNHPECFNHRTNPCENCGRIARYYKRLGN